jgi:predicted nuclease with TOPRIM domain
MDLSSVAVVAASVVGGSGLLGGVYALLKVRPETTGILVNAAQDVVIIQKGVIDDLRTGLKDARERIEALEDSNAAKETEAKRLKAENRRLTERVRHLEREIELLTKAQKNDQRFTDVEDRLSAEEARNTDIEAAARKARRRADEQEKRGRP